MTPEAAGWLRSAIVTRRDTAEKAGTGESARTWVGSDNGYDGGGEVHDGHGHPVVYDEGFPTMEQALHIALNDPRQILADCEAQLGILDLYGIWKGESAGMAAAGIAADAVQHVAGAYRHWPGWDEHFGQG